MLSLMRSPAKSALIFRKVNLLLMKGADRLTGEDLVRIAQVAEGAGAVIYISIPSWQVLLGVPGGQQEQVLKALRERGFDSVKVTRKLEEGSALQLKGRVSEGPLENRRVRVG